MGNSFLIVRVKYQIIRSTVELKEELKRRIDSVDDNNLLNEILHLIEWESGKDEVFKIPVEHTGLLR